MRCATCFVFFFFNDTATTEIYTLSLHDALPISWPDAAPRRRCTRCPRCPGAPTDSPRSEEHTSELQSQSNLVCRLLLEKKKPEGDPQRDHHPEGRASETDAAREAPAPYAASQRD